MRGHNPAHKPIFGFLGSVQGLTAKLLTAWVRGRGFFDSAELVLGGADEAVPDTPHTASWVPCPKLPQHGPDTRQ